MQIVEEVTKRVHKHFCDRCSDLISESEEIACGYAEEPEEFILEIRINGKAYDEYRATLCEECANKQIAKVKALIGAL